MIVALVSFYVTYISYRNLKSFLPFVTDANFDRSSSTSERWLFFGNDPAEFLHNILGTGISAEFLSAVYLAFLTFVPISLAIALIWSNRLRVGVTYVSALSICWILGALSYYVAARARPGLRRARRSSRACPTRASRSFRRRCSSIAARSWPIPHSTNAVQSIAAFASLHTGVLVRRGPRRAPRPARIARSGYGLWAMLGFTVIATVYFGWHYIVDDFAGLSIGALRRLRRRAHDDATLGSSSPRGGATLIPGPLPGSSRAAP